MDLLEFMNNSPWLTFFLALIIGGTVASIVKSLMGINDCDCDCDN